MENVLEDMDDLQFLPSYAAAAFEQYPPRLASKRSALGLARRRPGGPRQVSLRPHLPRTIPPARNESIRKTPLSEVTPVPQPPPTPAPTLAPTPTFTLTLTPTPTPTLPSSPSPPYRQPTPATHPNQKDLFEIEIDSSFLDDLDEQLLHSPMAAFLDACWEEVLSDSEGPPELTLGSRLNSPMTMTPHAYAAGRESYAESLDPFELEEGELEWAPATELVGERDAEDVVDSSHQRTPTQTLPSSPSTAHSWCPMPEDLSSHSVHSADSDATTHLSSMHWRRDSDVSDLLSPLQWRRPSVDSDFDSLDEFSGPTITENLGSELTSALSEHEWRTPTDRKVTLPDRYDYPSPPQSSSDHKPPSLGRSATHTLAPPPPSAGLRPAPQPPIRLSWVPPNGHSSHGAQLLAYWEPHFMTSYKDGVNASPSRPLKKTGSGGRWRKLDIFGSGRPVKGPP
ncbi:hypothetical protein FIBSPDRAFT_1039590 [Athelia psychrophila]|uniref:Uncharacterized protein n=1 Tax=Athelia psychrophila TaxID=1759441 RepID=A0A166RNI6_9AGAM|nr:hypothetical protein FIBSPDRAFT_1039590 [Fibularhizoctonia sp. CBS 109695]